MGSLMRTGSVSTLGFPGPARFSARTRKLYFFLVGSPFTLQPHESRVRKNMVRIFFTYKYLSPHWRSCNFTAVIIYLKVVSLMGSLLHLIHLSLSGSNFSTQYPVMGLPPSSSGSNQVRVTASLAMSEGVTLVGGPGGSETRGKLCDLSLDISYHFIKSSKGTIFDRWLDSSVKKHTKGILCNDWCMLCRFADAILVLSADPKDVLLHSCELAGFESGVFHRG